MLQYLSVPRGGAMVYFLVQTFLFGQHELELFFFCHALRIFFPEFNIRLYDKNSELDYLFFPPPKTEYFFSNIGNQNIFLEKKHSPPLEVNWSVPNHLL